MSASTRPRIAYFCMEYGLSSELPIYSGGLGVLAGDHMKSAGDLRLPITGIGLFWSEGYTKQIIDGAGAPQDIYPTTPKDALTLLDVEIEVTVGDRPVLCHAYKVDRYTSATLYLLEPKREQDRWITRRLYGGGDEDRLAQEIVLGVGGVRLLQALGHEVDVYHFNEGHAVFAGLELVRQRCEAGQDFHQACAQVREHVVFTTHTPVPAGNEVHGLDIMRRMSADLGFTDAELSALGGAPFSMTVAGLRLSRIANGVAQLHGETARVMWSGVSGGAPIIAITNGVHAPTWQDARIRAATVADKSDEQQRAEIWDAHQAMKAELCALIAERTGIELRCDRLLIGFARRAAMYKRADLVFGHPERFEPWLRDHGVQFVFAGKAHPRDHQGKAMVSRVVEASRRWSGNVVFLENYDMDLGAALTRGVDIWLNNPRWPKEASGTSGMKAAMNGVLNVSILDGWWPEGCRHGETGWQIGTPDPGDSYAAEESIDHRDREALYRVFADEVIPRYYEDRDQWLRMMQASIAMARWRFSSDRMLQEYFATLYRSGAPH
jgi:glycogen phosphorylase